MAVVRKRSNFAIWRDVIFAIFLREIKSKFNDRVGISWAVISPVIFIFGLSFGRSLIGGDIVHTVPTFVFMLYGMIGVQLFLITFNSCSNSFKKNKPLFAFRQVQPFSAVIAVALFEYLSKVFVVIFLAIIMYFMGTEIRIDDGLMILVYITLLWLLALGLGLIFAILQGFVEEIEKARELLSRPLFFISGVFFSLQDVPSKYWAYLDWNPILHAIELIRFSAYQSYGQTGVDGSFLAQCVLIVFALGCFMYQAYWKQVISR